MFYQVELRTTDADAARTFYNRVLGHDRAMIWPLHEQAIARGAKPHWLGHIRVDNADKFADAFVERGAMRYGPTQQRADGMHIAVLRDPGGAILAVSTPAQKDVAPTVDVAWHVLNTNQAAMARTNYQALFGWTMTGTADAGEHGQVETFSWHRGEKNIGVIADIEGRAGVHPHWLFFFEVESLARACEIVRELGGKTLDVTTLPNGDQLCVCDDPQGAAFALCERKHAH